MKNYLIVLKEKKYIYRLIIVLFFALSVLVSAENEFCSLIVKTSLTNTEFEIDNQSKIIRYDFNKAKLIESVELFSFNKYSKDNVLKDFKIINNRYLVSKNCTVLDLEKRKIIGRLNGKLLGVDKNYLIVDKRNYFFKNYNFGNFPEYIENKYLYRFNLITNEYIEFPYRDKWHLVGVKSPDKTKSIAFSRRGNCLVLMDSYKRKSLPLTGEINFSKKYHKFLILSCFEEPSCFEHIMLVLWLDNNRIIVHTKNGILTVFNLNSMKKEKILKFNVGKADYPPSLEFFDKESFIYDSGTHEYFLINKNNFKFEKLNKLPINESNYDKVIFKCNELSIEWNRLGGIVFYKKNNEPKKLLTSNSIVIGWLKK